MDDVELKSGDFTSVAIFSTLRNCKAIVPVVTEGYAQTLQCLRELYYVKSIEAAQLLPVILEDGWETENAGEWLKLMVGEVKCHGVSADDESVAFKIAKVNSL